MKVFMNETFTMFVTKSLAVLKSDLVFAYTILYFVWLPVSLPCIGRSYTFSIRIYLFYHES